MPHSTNPAPWIALGIGRTTYYKRITENRRKERLFACLPSCYHSQAGIRFDLAVQAWCEDQDLDYSAVLTAYKLEHERQKGKESFGIDTVQSLLKVVKASDLLTTLQKTVA